MFEELLERVKYYRRLGVNPLSLATGCAVKVDLIRVVYPALKELKPKLESRKFRIAPREDADIFKCTFEGVELHRRIYELGREARVDPNDIREIGSCRSIAVIQAYQRYADNPQKFLELIAPIYMGLAEANVEIHLGKGHSIVTPFEEDQFALFDFIKPVGREVEGFTAANNDTIHIVDPTEEPGDYRQVAGALSNTLNDLFVLGVYKDLKIAPVVNAPLEELVEKMFKNVRVYAESIGAEVVEVPQPKRGRLLVGATVLGSSDKRPPTFYDKVEPGMKLVATRPFGELVAVNVYLAAVIDENVVREVEDRGLMFEEVEKMKEDAVNKISTPNIEAAKVINKYLPGESEEYNSEEHIAATTDVTGPGIYVVWELAELASVKIRLHNIPILYPELAEYATSTYIIPNATSGTNGAFIAVIPEGILESFLKDLKSKGLNPVVFGEVVEKGKPEVEAPLKLKRYVADSEVLSKFNLK